ncbi:hypothetical protein BGW80DRAFT_1561772 [Lactifluus volemus]|nr:hypothetical protein BGW80DRAFT_1561772 [Lactifluus volemus]
MDGLSMGSNNKNLVAYQQKELLIQRELEPSQVFQEVTIGSLPDNVLLDIFDFYQVVINLNVFMDDRPWDWEKLLHVCRRWRYIVFESPIRLNLQLFCTEKSPVRKLLDIWPPYPLVIQFNYDYTDLECQWEDSEDHCHWIDSMDNLVAALERRDRIREIQVYINNAPDRLFEQMFMAMEKPFPALRSLSFQSVFDSEIFLELDDTFLNGSAPCLRDLSLWGISFPSLPLLLSSTSDLTCLILSDIPDSGYIPPETMATSLSALPKLESLIINFDSLTGRLERRTQAPPPQTRFVLPALTRLDFEGESEYLEVLAARFDAPLLNEFAITFTHQSVFDIPQTVRLLNNYLDSFEAYSLTLTFERPRDRHCASIIFPLDHPVFRPSYLWLIMCKESDRQVVSVTQICSQILPFRSGVKSLIIKWDSDTEVIEDSTLWLQLFHSFPSLQNLQIPAVLEPSIASALERPTEGSPAAAEVFPSLHSISIVDKMAGKTVQEPIQSFVAARQRSGRLVAVSRVRY